MCRLVEMKSQPTVEVESGLVPLHCRLRRAGTGKCMSILRFRKVTALQNREHGNQPSNQVTIMGSQERAEAQDRYRGGGWVVRLLK